MDLSRYLDLFLAESREHLGAAHTLLSELEQRPAQSEPWRAFMRHAHSLKGMAASMQFDSMVALTHAAEALAERLEAAPPSEAGHYHPLLGEALACLGDLLDRIERGEQPASPRADALAQALRGGQPADAAPSVPGQAEDPPRPGALDTVQKTGRRRWRLDLSLGDRSSDSAQRIVALLAHVRRLGRVVHSVPPQLETATGRFQGRLRLVFESEHRRQELDEALRSRVDADAFTLEAEPLPQREAPRDTKPAPRIRVRADKLDAIVDDLLDLRQQQARLKAALPSATGRLRHDLDRAGLRLKEIYSAMLELRLLPFETAAQRLHQAVHDLAGTQRKPVRFEISGSHVLLDRAVLETLVEPLMHMLKNAVDHGIESADERRAAGKAPTGSLRLSLERGGDRLAVVVTDDGRGMSPGGLRRTAVERGLLSREDAADLTDEEALLLATFPRLTTRRDANHVSGRGVGLDVVRDRVESLGGFVGIRSEPGRGCELHLSIPLRRALIPTLLVRCAGEIYALPVDAVARTVDPKWLTRDAAPGEAVPETIRLDVRLGLAPSSSPDPARPRALILAASPPLVALLVDEVIGRKDLVVQPLRTPLTQLHQYSGAALLEDGTIAVVLDPSMLTRGEGIRLGASAPSCGSAP